MLFLVFVSYGHKITVYGVHHIHRQRDRESTEQSVPCLKYNVCSYSFKMTETNQQPLIVEMQYMERSVLRIVKMKAEAASALIRQRANKHRKVQSLLWKQLAVKEYRIQSSDMHDRKALISVGYVPLYSFYTLDIFVCVFLIVSCMLCRSEIDRMLQHPEHFPRDPKASAASSSSRSSPWEGSDYKMTLLSSLEAKLLLSLGFVSIKRYLDIKRYTEEVSRILEKQQRSFAYRKVFDVLVE